MEDEIATAQNTMTWRERILAIAGDEPIMRFELSLVSAVADSSDECDAPTP